VDLEHPLNLRRGETTMKWFSRLTRASIVPAFFYLSFPQTADDYYLETGGFILPWIAAALVGISVAIGIYWRKIKTFFGGRFRKDKSIMNDDDSV
jgi:hypothetical protein